MAWRRLGRLCGAWQEAGLAAIAVFEDPLEVAVRVARRLGSVVIVLGDAARPALSVQVDSRRGHALTSAIMLKPVIAETLPAPTCENPGLTLHDHDLDHDHG